IRQLDKHKKKEVQCKTCSEPKQISSSSAIYDNPNLIKPIPVKPRENQQQRIPQPSQTLDSEPQHLSLMTLFGKQDKATCREIVEPPQIFHQEKLPVRQGVVRSLSYEEPKRHSPLLEKQLCPAIQKLMVRSADLHPLSELPENRPCENGSPHSAGEVFTGLVQPACFRNIGTSHRAQSASKSQSLLEKLRSAPVAGMKYIISTPGPTSRTLTAAAPAAPGKALAQPPLAYFNGSLPPETLGPQAPGKEQSVLPRPTLPLSCNQTSSCGVVSPQELLRKLQIVQQEQQLHAASRPALAAKFPVVTQSSRTAKPSESWMDKTSSTERQAPIFRSTLAPSKERDSGLLPLGSQEPAAASTSLFLPLKNPEPSAITSNPLTKLQLQEALLYLIQNDDNFLNIIYEAYLFSMTQAAMKKT
uniref:Decapping mRNA 1B n=1 Tax=Loxodonta africana TaxID=9785 RepID=G3T013_LOXAF